MSTLNSCPGEKLAWFDEARFPTLCWGPYSFPATVLPVAACFLLLLLKFVQQQQRHPQEHRHLEKHEQDDRDYVGELLNLNRLEADIGLSQLPREHGILTELVRIVAIMAPFISCALVTNYLTTCIGWLYWLGQEAGVPALDGAGFLGIFAFLAAWIAMSLPAICRSDHRRANRKPWPTFVYELIFDAEAVGWAITVQLGFWILLEAVIPY